MRPAKSFHPASEAILSLMEKQYIYEAFVDLAECMYYSLCRNNHILQVRPSNFCVVPCVAL